MGLLSEVERLINEHASAAIMKERLALWEDRYTAIEEKNADLTLKASELEVKVADLEAKIEDTESQLQILQQQPGPADTCPYCRNASGQLLGIKSHRKFGDMGAEVRSYRCDNCGKEYTKNSGLA